MSRPAGIPFQDKLQRAYQHMRAGRVAEAEAICRRIVKRQKAHPQANFALAMIMESRGLTGPAIAHLRLVVQSQPENLDARLGLANNLRRLRRDEEALGHLEIVARSRPGTPGIYNNMGNICRDLRRAKEAERYLLKAIELKPDTPEAHNNLGALYSEQGRTDEAINCFRRAIAAKSDYCQAHRNLATTRRHEQYDDEIRAMERLFDRPGAKDYDKMQLGFGLGKACDELLLRDKAFGYWQEANRCQRMLSPYDIQHAIGEMKTMPKIFDMELLRRADGARSEQVPIFIVGMPRSGTSLTEQILASHSAVFGAGELELIDQLTRSAVKKHPADLHRLSAADWRHLGTNYLAEIARLSGGERCVVDKLPGNFLNIGMIRMMLADARVIHCRRDPMDTGLSCFKNHFLGARLDYTCDLDDLGVYYRHYEALMAYWHRVEAAEIYENTYEVLVGAPETEIPKLLEFCSLPFEDACLSFHETRRMVATASMAQVRQPIHQRSVRKWLSYEKQLQPLADSLARPASL